MGTAQYAFGDSALAGERLEILAGLFAPAARSILREAPAPVRRIADLGCGPGYTTALLHTTFPDAAVVGFEASAAFVEAAKTRAAAPVSFVQADITHPLPGGPYDLIYARFLLAHLPAPVAAIATWCDGLVSGGALVLEETESITTTDAEFARYERLSVSIVEATGAALYAGPLIETATLPPGARRVVDRVIDIDLSAGEAASLFWRNLATWGHDAVALGLTTEADVVDLLEHLRAREHDPTRGCFEWRQRQTVLGLCEARSL